MKYDSKNKSIDYTRKELEHVHGMKFPVKSKSKGSAIKKVMDKMKKK